MAIKETTIKRFDMGLGHEKRDLPDGYFRYLENVNVGDQFKSIKQVPNVASSEGSKAMRHIIQAGSSVYGLGQDGSNYQTIYKLSGTSSTPAWGTITNGTATGYTRNAGTYPFFAYINGTIYYASNGYVGKYQGTTNTPNLVVAPYNMQGGMVQRSKIYGWAGQVIQEFDPSDDSLTAKITVPSDQTIIDLVPMGDLMFIICTSSVKGTPSKAYIWDRVSTTAFYDIINIGFGDVSGGTILDGQLFVVIGFQNRRGFRIKKYTGTIFINEFTYFGLADENPREFAIPSSRVKAVTNYIYFMVDITRPGETSVDYENMVLFRYGRTDETKTNALSVYKTLKENVVTGRISTSINDFIISENYHPSGDADFPDRIITCSVTDGTSMDEVTTQLSSGDAVYSAQPGVVDTSYFTGGDSSINKNLRGIKVTYNALAGSGQVDLKYKADGDTSWTTIFTENTAGSIAHESVNIESTGAELPIFKEIAFRIELLNGAELTGLKFKYEEENQSFYTI
jgi:hypothetical protein